MLDCVISGVDAMRWSWWPVAMAGWCGFKDDGESDLCGFIDDGRLGFIDDGESVGWGERREGRTRLCRHRWWPS